MHRFGRQCRGMGNVFVTLVRQTETQLLELGQPVLPLARASQACLHCAPQLSEDQRARNVESNTGGWEHETEELRRYAEKVAA